MLPAVNRFLALVFDFPRYDTSTADNPRGIHIRRLDAAKFQKGDFLVLDDYTMIAIILVNLWKENLNNWMGICVGFVVDNGVNIINRYLPFNYSGNPENTWNIDISLVVNLPHSHFIYIKFCTKNNIYKTVTI